MSLHDMLKDIPYHSLLAVNNLLGALDGLHDTALNELTDDERLIELGCHELGDTALVHLQLRTYDDNRTRGIVHTLTEKVLTETTLLTLERVRQRLERTVHVALHGRRLAAVVEQRVNRLLEKTLLVAENHLGSLDLDETFQTVVTYDDTTVEVVEVGSGETAAIQRHERTKFRRDDRNGLEHHPLGTVTVGRSDERVHDLKTLQGLGLALLRTVGVGAFAELCGESHEVDVLKEFINRLGTHTCHKLIGVGVLKILVAFGQSLENLHVLFLSQELKTLQLAGLARLNLNLDIGGVDDHVTLVVDDILQLLRRNTEQVADLVGERAEVPDVSHGHDELDVPHTLATHLLLGNFHTTAVADDAFVADALVLTAMALVVLDRTEDLLAEETVALRLVGTVVDGLGLEDLAA